MKNYSIISKAFKRFYSSAAIIIEELTAEISSIAAKNLHFHRNLSILRGVHVY